MNNSSCFSGIIILEKVKMKDLTPYKDKLKKEHDEIYSRMEYLMLELTKVKNKRDDQHLLKSSKELVEYVGELLNEHFTEEENEFFPELLKEKPELAEVVSVLLKDHQQIKEKYNFVISAIEVFEKQIEFGIAAEFDYQQELLFPAYNLIATINHHAQREDREIFSQAL